MQSLSVDSGNLQFREVTAKSFGFVIAFASFEFEGDTFRASKLVNNLGGDCGSIDDWAANAN